MKNSCGGARRSSGCAWSQQFPVMGIFNGVDQVGPAGKQVANTPGVSALLLAPSSSSHVMINVIGLSSLAPFGSGSAG
jgi:hypothetical protein